MSVTLQQAKMKNIFNDLEMVSIEFLFNDKVSYSRIAAQVDAIPPRFSWGGGFLGVGPGI